MRIALITNKKLHHKYWASELYKKHNISLILHPLQKKQSILRKIRSKNLFKYGKINFLLKILSLIYSQVSKNGLNKRLSIAGKIFFSNYLKSYNSIPKNKIMDVDTVNSIKSIGQSFFMRSKPIEHKTLLQSASIWLDIRLNSPIEIADIT